MILQKFLRGTNGPSTFLSVFIHWPSWFYQGSFTYTFPQHILQRNQWPLHGQERSWILSRSRYQKGKKRRKTRHTLEPCNARLDKWHLQCITRERILPSFCSLFYVFIAALMESYRRHPTKLPSTLTLALLSFALKSKISLWLIRQRCQISSICVLQIRILLAL